MEFQISKLAKVNLNNANDLPDSGGLYFAIDDASRVWYVGIASESLRDRHQKHERKEDFKKHCTKIAYLPYGDEEDLRDWEAAAIDKYNPPLNANLKEPELPIVDLGYSKEKYLQRYREIKLLLESLEQELEDLKPAIVTLVEENGAPVKIDGLTASVTKRKKWEYSTEVTQLNDSLKQRKKYEEANGIATISGYTIYPSVRVS